MAAMASGVVVSRGSPGRASFSSGSRRSSRVSPSPIARAKAAERARLEEQTRAAITAMTQAAEDTRQVAARHAETARNQVDQLSEAAFTAGQQANKVFEARR